ncbi:MAG: type II secretion system protein [Cyanobacteria bacterium SIG30]|nr:type II secretion system protein [Cyanobacteria bacterium SIG30]
MRKKGFTLAEVLIVIMLLSVIGTMLISLVKFILPNENEAKLKKAYNTLTQTVQYLTNDSTIYGENLGDMVSSTTDPAGYFCKHFADQVSVKSAVVCNNSTDTATQAISLNASNVEGSFDDLDNACDKRTSNFAFETIDGVSWYGFRDTFSSSNLVEGIDLRYVVVCVDPEPDSSKVLPYAFGVRRDGKILVGKRAQDVLEGD